MAAPWLSVAQAALLQIFLPIAVVGAGCAGEIESNELTDAGSDGEAADVGGADDAGPSPDAGAPGDELGSFKLTYYYVTYEADYDGVADTDIFEPGCVVLATVPAAFANSLR